MVKTRIDLKLKIKEWIADRDTPFKTYDVQQYSQKIAPNIRTSPQRLQNYIRGANSCKFNKNRKEWIRIVPLRE